MTDKTTTETGTIWHPPPLWMRKVRLHLGDGTVRDLPHVFPNDVEEIRRWRPSQE
ncbi:MAG: hypothetical protein WBG57_10620 [Ornithinimicrobium sp.]